MPIVISNFEINLRAPIDTRMVATDSTAMNAIQFPYPGLKTFLLSDAKTYVYGTDSVWRIDSGGSVNTTTQGGGIYGGSGSLPDNVGVYFGDLTTTVNDKTDDLYYFTGPDTDDQSNILNYFYRNASSGDFDSLSFRIEQKLKPLNLTELQSSFIEFNSKDILFPSHYGNLSLGTRRSDGSRGRKLIVGSKNHVSISPSGLDSDIPLTIGDESSEIYIGYNYNPNSDSIFNANQSKSIDSSLPSTRIRMSGDFEIQSRVEEQTTYNSLLKLQTNQLPDSVTSPVLLRMDNSARDWDVNATRNSTLLTVPNFIRNSEHRFTKLQSWDQGESTSLVSNTLFIDGEGNSYTYEFTSNTFIQDIKIKRALGDSEVQDGTIITISFQNKLNSINGYIKIQDLAVSNGSKIRSEVSDYDFEYDSLANPPSTQRLTILHNPNKTNQGDTVVFRRMNSNWEIVSINREKKLSSRSWISAAKSTGNPFYLDQVYYLNNVNSGGTFQSLTSQITPRSVSPSVANAHPPGNYAYPSGAFRMTANPQGFYFRVSSDGNKIVFIQGGFRILITQAIRENNGFWWTDNFSTNYEQYAGRKNVWRIGKIDKSNLQPEWDSTWTPVIMYFQMIVNGTPIPVTIPESWLSISTNGDIFLTFRAILPDGGDGDTPFTAEIDVWVPTFSYIAKSSVLGNGATIY